MAKHIGLRWFWDLLGVFLGFLMDFSRVFPMGHVAGSKRTKDF